ncbi:hypothetical protein [Cumulibacter soli]|uniref:hypothetical protein n=1 Tax=Cumulibacter soli TaxID=2546344 RepID=UPI00141A2AD0|nr:hypothetical protein [Cumulibacter soli]
MGLGTRRMREEAAASAVVDAVPVENDSNKDDAVDADIVDDVIPPKKATARRGPKKAQ